MIGAWNVAEPLTLGDFISQEINVRGMSVREFADHIGVSHSIINKFLNHGKEETYSGKPIGDPSFEFIRQLAKGTNQDAGDLAALALSIGDKRDRAEVNIIARRIANLDEKQREMVDVFLRGLRTQD